MRRKCISALVGVGMCLCLTSCSILPTEQEFDAAPVVKEFEGGNYNKVSVTRGTLQKTEEITGKYKGTVREEVMPDGVSVVKNIHVKKGQRVEEGTTIMSYVLPGSENSLKTAENKIAKTKLQIQHARKLMELEVEKQKKIGGSKSQIDNIRNQYEQQIKSYESSLELTQMDAKIAREEIEEEEVTASVTGKVTFVDQGVIGTYGSVDDAAIIIEGASRNRFEASSEYASHCKDGEEVTIEVKGQDYKATVQKDKESSDIVYFYPKTKLNIEDGTVGSFRVVLKELKDVLYLPSSIVYTMGEKHVVYYEDENGLKTMKEVTVGETISNYVEITGGLEEDEQVIAN